MVKDQHFRISGSQSWAQKVSWSFEVWVLLCTPFGPTEGLAAMYISRPGPSNWNHVEEQTWRPGRSGILRKKGACNSVAVQIQSRFRQRQTVLSARSKMGRLRLWTRVPVCDWSVLRRQVSSTRHVIKVWLWDYGFFPVHSCGFKLRNNHITSLPSRFCRTVVSHF